MRSVFAPLGVTGTSRNRSTIRVFSRPSRVTCCLHRCQHMTPPRSPSDLLAELLGLLRQQHAQKDCREKTTLAGRRTGLAAEYGVEAMLGRHFDARNIQV